MLHGPCGNAYPNAPCMVNGKCSKHYPKKFCSETTIDEDGFVSYRRRDDPSKRVTLMVLHLTTDGLFLTIEI